MKTLRVTQADLLKGLPGTDIVYLTFEDLSTPFPPLDKQSPGQYPAKFKMEVTKGYGEQWCRDNGIELDKIIDAGIGEVTHPSRGASCKS